MHRSDRIIVTICLLWLGAWTLLGVYLGVAYYRSNSLLRNTIAITAVCIGIGCIALIGLWPHRAKLQRKHISRSRGFEVHSAPIDLKPDAEQHE